MWTYDVEWRWRCLTAAWLHFLRGSKWCLGGERRSLSCLLSCIMKREQGEENGFTKQYDTTEGIGSNYWLKVSPFEAVCGMERLRCQD